MKTNLLILSLVLVSVVSSRAQYPTISSAISAEAKAKQSAADQRSDEAFAKAQPAIKAWAAKGKPYLPGAAEPKDLPQASVPSFPGAWGGGMYSFGGRGGTTFIVTNLADSGPGTFREACEAGGPRTVVFNVAGIIHLKDRIRIRAPYITIVGNTAPGDGVCLAGNTVELETHDVVIRYMRFRRGATDVGDRNDSLGGNPTGNIMIDHVSGSWGLDENMSMYRHMYQPLEGGKELKLPTVNITMQNCIFSEGLNTYHHAFGSTIGGLNSTFHHNLWACNTGRNPSVGMIGDFTFINNVVFNWVHRTVDGGDHRSYYTIENNYFKPGPATPTDKEIGWRLLKPESERSKTVQDHFGIAYVHGNIVEGNAKVTADNWDGGVQPDVKVESLKEALAKIRTDIPFPHAPLPMQTADKIFATVLANAGATLPVRDAVDKRVTEMVRTGKVATQVDADVAVEASRTGYSKAAQAELQRLAKLGLITSPAQVGGYPEYKGEPYTDLGADGIRKSWKEKYHLNLNDAGLANKDLQGDGYTVVEKYLYDLDPTKKFDWAALQANVNPAK
jgi:hypothetical protein